MTTAREALEMAAKECDAEEQANSAGCVKSGGVHEYSIMAEAAKECAERIRALAASLPAEPAALPEGWVMVPKERMERLAKLEAQLATTYHGPWRTVEMTQGGSVKVFRQTGERSGESIGCYECGYFSKEQGEAVASTLNRLSAAPKPNEEAK